MRRTIGTSQPKPLAKITAVQKTSIVGSIVSSKRTAIETAKLKAKWDSLKRPQDIDRRRDELKQQQKELERLDEQEKLHGELSAAEAIQKIRSLRLHAAQAYSRHIFEHKINV